MDLSNQSHREHEICYIWHQTRHRTCNQFCHKPIPLWHFKSSSLLRYPVDTEYFPLQGNLPRRRYMPAKVMLSIRRNDRTSHRIEGSSSNSFHPSGGVNESTQSRLMGSQVPGTVRQNNSQTVSIEVFTIIIVIVIYYCFTDVWQGWDVGEE